MTQPDFDIDDVLSALRDDLPNDEDDRRMRLRLAGAMGSFLGTGLLLTQSSAGASTTGSAGLTSTAGSGPSLSGSELGLSGSELGLSGSELGFAASGVGAAVGTGSVPAASGTVGLLAQFTALSTGAQMLLATAALLPLTAAVSASVGLPAATYLAPRSSEPLNPAATAQMLAAPQEATIPLKTAAARQAAIPLKTTAPQQAAAPSSLSSVQDLTTPSAESHSVQPETEPPKLAPKHLSVESASKATAETSIPAGRLHEETLLLERALQAIAGGENQGALKWLDLHEQRFPTGALAPERERTRARLTQ